uniref:Outer membrane efflux protein n=1 Tax=Solibacter usitatus (strain Ellin6076) TaxID=234267 RepID=Q01NG6_SOLUE
MKLRIAIAVALAGSAFGQQPAPLKLTLHDAVQLALKQNPQVILANLDVQQSQEDRNLARSALLPQVHGAASETVSRVNLEAAIGFRFPGFSQHVGPYRYEQAGVNLQAPVFDLTLWRRYRASVVGIETSRIQELGVREESVLLVVSQYLGSQRAAADVQAAQSRVDLAQALYDQAADLQKNGVGTGIDTLRANVQLQNEKQRQIVARTQLETSLFGLARLLNIDPRTRVELADQVSFFDTPTIDVNQTLEQAWQVRPELRQVLSQEQRAELDLQGATDARLPRVAVNGFWSQQGLNSSTAIPVYTYQATVEVPIFTGGRIQADRAKAEITIRQLKQQEQEVRNRIALEVKNAIAQLASARNEVDVANLGIQLARQEVDQSRDRFQAGVTNNVEVIQAQDSFARASDNQIAALYRYNQSRADLAHSIGQMEALYAR